MTDTITNIVMPCHWKWARPRCAAAGKEPSLSAAHEGVARPDILMLTWERNNTRPARPGVRFGKSVKTLLLTNNVISSRVWDKLNPGLQQILIEEGAKPELEALRLASIQN